MSKIRRTVSYLKRNGIANTITAVLERIDKKGMDQAGRQAASYMRQVTTKERWEMDALSGAENRTWEKAYTFSILVPAYETDETYLREMIDSVLGQSYKKLQLVLADASASDRVERVAKTYRDDRLTYFRLQENAGISHNTNEALAHATGEYIGLLDHDDLLCKDALAYMMQRLEKQDYLFLYTDEDKIDQTGTTVFEPNWKPDFNLDYLLSNNYICHFSAIRADLMKSCSFAATMTVHRIMICFSALYMRSERKDQRIQKDVFFIRRCIWIVKSHIFRRSVITGGRISVLPQTIRRVSSMLMRRESVHWRTLQGRTDGRRRSVIQIIWAFTGSTGRIFLCSARMLWQSAQMSVEEAGWRKVAHCPVQSTENMYLRG